MSMTKMSQERPQEINTNRRSFLGIAAIATASAQLGGSDPLDAQVRRANTSASLEFCTFFGLPSPRSEAHCALAERGH